MKTELTRPHAPRKIGGFVTYRGARIEKHDREHYKIYGIGHGWQFRTRYDDAIRLIDEHRPVKVS